MGLTLSRLLNSLFERKHLRILMVGLDGAGKTTILYKLKLGEVITSIPTIGFNVETVEYKNIRFTDSRVRAGFCAVLEGCLTGVALWPHLLASFLDVVTTVWDIGGQDRIRPLWKRYFQNTQGIIFVVDSTDRERIAEAAKELDTLLTDEELRSAMLLVFANKQDLPVAMSPSELVDKLRLNSYAGRKWYIQSACATLSHGLYEGLEWLSKELAKK